MRKRESIFSRMLPEREKRSSSQRTKETKRQEKKLERQLFSSPDFEQFLRGIHKIRQKLEIIDQIYFFLHMEINQNNERTFHVSKPYGPDSKHKLSAAKWKKFTRFSRMNQEIVFFGFEVSSPRFQILLNGKNHPKPFLFTIFLDLETKNIYIQSFDLLFHIDPVNGPIGSALSVAEFEEFLDKVITDLQRKKLFRYNN